MTHLLALQNGTELVSDFRIERVLGAGGFGITYLAAETALERRVTIKEYFPSDFAARVEGQGAVPRSKDCAGDYQWGLERFIAEAQTLARFNHPNIVRVYRYFEANNTAYMVLHFEEGQSFKGWLKSLGRAPRQKELDGLVAPLLDALEVVHKADFLHRDIAPDNIIIRKDGTPVLIDFGAARGEIAAHSKTVSALVKPGYSPYEQYAEKSSRQGPWTDIYALGATLYHAVTGRRPPDAPSRMVKDELVGAREAALAAYRQGFLAAIDKALALDIEARPKSVAEWRGALLAPDPAKPGLLSALTGRRRDDKPPLVARAGGSLGEAVPPPPDAPGRHGGMLDFIDGLKGKQGDGPRAAASPAPAPPPSAKPDPPPAAAPAPTVKLPEAPASPPQALGAARKKRARAGQTPDAAAAKGRRLWTPRPRPVRGSFGSWRPLLVKLLIGAGLAAGVVGLQDHLPRFEQRGESVVAKERGEVAPMRLIRAHRGAASFVAFSDDGRHIVSAGQDATIKLWHADSGGLARTIELDNGPPTALAVAGRRALTGHADGTVVLWDVDKGDRIASYRQGGDSIWALTFLADGARFAAGSQGEDVAVWEARSSSQPAFLLEGHDGATHALAVSPASPYLASGSADRTVKLWNVNGQSLVRTYRGQKGFVTAVAFAPEGKLLASGDLEGAIRVWSTTSSRLQRTLHGHRGRVAALSFSPASDLLASVGEDGVVRLWDFRKGRTARLMTGHAGVVRSVAYAPDGRRIASAGEDGTIRLWDAILPRPQQEARDER